MKVVRFGQYGFLKKETKRSRAHKQAAPADSELHLCLRRSPNAPSSPSAKLRIADQITSRAAGRPRCELSSDSYTSLETRTRRGVPAPDEHGY